VNALNQKSARELILHLKAGTTPLDMVRYINVGNELWYRGCEQLFTQVEQSGDSLVRFINGYYGDGKTHFLGMLRGMAFDRKWAVGYVSAETTPFSRYDLVLAQLVKNMVLPDTLPTLDWLPRPQKGGERLFGAFFTRHYIAVTGGTSRDGLNSFGVHEDMGARVNASLNSLRMHDALGKAAREFVKAALSQDAVGLREIPAWLEGQEVDVTRFGIKKKLSQDVARDVLRGISLLAKGAGIAGVLVLLDEAERILGNTRSVRRKSYGVIRDLLDNADDQGGMPTSMFYIAATPDMFSKAEGFAEYDALRSRLASSQRFSVPGLVDTRGVVVDLTKTPLNHKDLVQVARKIRDVHALAEGWDPSERFSDAVIESIVSRIEAGVFQVSKMRMLASSVATLIDIAEQNPALEVAPILGDVFKQVSKTLSAVPTQERWE
jgi:hypothetical protein